MAELRRKLHGLLSRAAYRLRVRLRTRHVHGARTVRLDPSDVIVLCLVKNGELCVRSFVDHYSSLGAKHIVFMDNGSTDRTVPLAMASPNVTVLMTGLPFRTCKQYRREYLVRRFARDRWSIYADVDELFDYPYSGQSDLRRLTTYLDSRSYNAVVAQMLDMFSDGPLSSVRSEVTDSLREKYRHYDLTDVTSHDYETWAPTNHVSNSRIRFLRGGIRKGVFGSDVYLTKHPMVRWNPAIELFAKSSHKVRNASTADWTGVLYHYKFLGDFERKAREAAVAGNYSKDSREYRAYLEALETDGAMALKRPTAKELAGVDQLVSDGFLVVSEAYRNFMGESGACEPAP